MSGSFPGAIRQSSNPLFHLTPGFWSRGSGATQNATPEVTATPAVVRSVAPIRQVVRERGQFGEDGNSLEDRRDAEDPFNRGPWGRVYDMIDAGDYIGAARERARLEGSIDTLANLGPGFGEVTDFFRDPSFRGGAQLALRGLGSAVVPAPISAVFRAGAGLGHLANDDVRRQIYENTGGFSLNEGDNINDRVPTGPGYQFDPNFGFSGGPTPVTPDAFPAQGPVHSPQLGDSNNEGPGQSRSDTGGFDFNDAGGLDYPDPGNAFGQGELGLTSNSDFDSTVGTVGLGLDDGGSDAGGGDDGGGCFLTTAACGGMNLPDDCPELETLRAFRDDYLMTFHEGIDLVREYREIAPRIVDAINATEQKANIWPHIYRSMVLPCVRYVEGGQYDRAISHYRAWVHALKAAHLEEEPAQ